MRAKPRVAFFTDSYLEVNGVARTSREFAAFVKRRSLPLLCVHAGPQTEKVEEGSLTRLALKRSSIGVKYDADQHFDLLMGRHLNLVIETVREFKPDLLHMTGPSDIGLLGTYVGHTLRIPRVYSWHTNLHTYAGRRLGKYTSFLPRFARSALTVFIERLCLEILFKFYGIGRVLFAPNRELCVMLEQQCGKPVFMMKRGVDADRFSPARRQRRDHFFTVGYVGRLTPEKNLRLLAEIERDLVSAGQTDFRFLIVGAGSERNWLEKNLQRAEFTGVLQGEALARAYANLDLFIFPSGTDTFGNVVLEAQASGVPAIVSTHGGPKFTITDGVTGYVVNDNREYSEAILSLMLQPEKLQQMREAARELACSATWDKVFDQVYQGYNDSVQVSQSERVKVERAEVEPAMQARVRPSITTPDVIN
jgi:phosphatidylinositol alpha 1,6-mannosyltransferase